MARIIFWEKPGCAGNARQRALLVRSGHALDVRNLRDGGWSAATLRPFFGDRPVAEWFHASAPAVASGEIDPAALTEAEALALMVARPLLIRRPLMQGESWKVSGFDQAALAARIGIDGSDPALGDACLRRAGAP